MTGRSTLLPLDFKARVRNVAKKNGIVLSASALSKEETENIVKLLKEMKSGAEVARIVKRSNYAVCVVAKQNGIPLLGRRLSKKNTSS